MKKGPASFQSLQMVTSPELVQTCNSTEVNHTALSYRREASDLPSVHLPFGCPRGIPTRPTRTAVPPRPRSTAGVPQLCLPPRGTLLALGTSRGLALGTQTFPNPPPAEAALCKHDTARFCFQTKGDSSQFNRVITTKFVLNA